MASGEVLHYILTLNQLGFLKPAERILLFELFSKVDQLTLLDVHDIGGILRRRVNKSSWNPQKAIADAEKIAHMLGQSSISLVAYGDPHYPGLLKEIYDPPLLLFYRGQWPEWSSFDSLAMVGTRFPTGEARSAAFCLARDLAVRGVAIVSGLAKGIDKECHEGALSGQGFTAAVLGNGIDQIYPQVCLKTAHAILDKGGVLVSEYAPGTPPMKHHFPARNRIVSGLAKATLVVQAPVRSGALITADFALDQGRDLFVYSKGMNANNGQGGKKLAETGAPVIDRAEDILRKWGFGSDPTYDPGFSGSESKEEKIHFGLELAKALDKELKGQAIRHNGSLYRSE
ncbi:MAG: DNA-processing protein DprA [Spirochaetales bacterium]|nr:DNA-processing protein DprA [Spirochaetales bacterium]